LAEHRTLNPQVLGSSPRGRTSNPIRPGGFGHGRGRRRDALLAVALPGQRVLSRARFCRGAAKPCPRATHRPLSSAFESPLARTPGSLRLSCRCWSAVRRSRPRPPNQPGLLQTPSSRWISKRQRRYLKTWKQQDGMVRLDGLLDPETGTRICNRLQDTAEELCRQDQQTARTHAAASEGPAGGDAPAVGESPTSSDAPASGGPASSKRDADAGGSSGSEGTRSWDQLRADALDLLTSDTAGSVKERGGTGGRPRAEVIVVADIGALTGDDPAGRCEIPGTGPVPPEVLQRIACDAQLTGLLFNDGKPLRHGSTVRTATTKQWRALIARDRGCIGCGAEPSRCQAHHIVPYARLRRTDIENLVLVCWRCHHNIHDHHWQVVHRRGKPALEPPDPLAPPGPTDGRHPQDQHPRDPQRPRPGRSPQPLRARTRPASSPRPQPVKISAVDNLPMVDEPSHRKRT